MDASLIVLAVLVGMLVAVAFRQAARIAELERLEKHSDRELRDLQKQKSWRLDNFERDLQKFRTANGKTRQRLHDLEKKG